MKLKKKTLVVFISTLIAFLVILSIFFSTIIMASYSTLEEQYVKKDLSQAVNKIHDELFTMSFIASDWGPWDDTVNFVNGNDPNYLNSNLQPFGFDNLNLNLIIITNTKGDVLFSGAYDLNTKVMVPVPAFFSGQIDPKNPLMNMSDPHKVTTGILMLPDDPILIVSQPIVHSDYSGEPQGVIIMGRYLNKEEISRLAELTQPSLSFTHIDDPSLSPALVADIRKNASSETRIVQPLNSDQVAGYAPVRDIYGNDILVLQITETRDIYHQGINTTVQVIIIILAGGLFLGVLIIFLLDRVVLNRMRTLADRVNRIGKSGDARDHVDVEGDDELSGLAAEINRMLDTIEHAQQKVLASEARFRELAELLPLIIFEIDTTGNLHYVNKAGVDLFGINEHKIAQGVNIRDYLSPKNIEQMERGLAVVMSGAKSPGEIYTLKKLDGDLMRAIVYTSLIHREGKIWGFRGIVLDISERIRLEEALTESEEYLRSLIWSIRAGIFVVDAETHTIIDVNPAALELIGATKDAVINQLCHHVICPAEVGRCPITDLNQTVDNTERTLLTPDGRKISVIKYVVPVILHGKPCLLETFIDNSYRKQIELQLEESEEKYRTLAENSADIIFSLDNSGTVTYISPQVSRYGFAPQDVIGKEFQQFIHPYDRANVLKNYQNEIHEGTSISSIFRITGKQGTIHWIEENSNIKWDQQGNPVGMVGVLRDVSDRVRVEDALHESEEKYRALTENTGDILFSLDMSGIFTYISPQINKYGFLVEEILGKSLRVIVHPEDIDRVENDISRDLEKGAQSHSLFRILDKWGNVCWFDEKGTLRLDQSGKPLGIYGVLRDDSERKLAEERSTALKNLYMAIFDNAGSAMIIIAKDTSIILTNPGWETITGVSREDSIGRSWTDFVYPPDLEVMEKYHHERRVNPSNVPKDYSTRLIDTSKNIHYCLFSVVMIPGTSNSVAAIVDITERKRAEDAIELANKKLNLMNNITRHDILNTITGLLGCVDMANATTSPEERMLFLRDIKDLTRTIQRQIAFTREYQEVGVHLPLWQNVKAVMSRVLPNFATTSLGIFIELENVEIYADPLLEKVFYNLVDNAMRYGETITTIRFYFQISETGLSIICEDDGTGINPEEKKRIFERGVGRNTGMGLFLTREILGITGILIAENGTYGKGARFEILIPKGAYRFAR